MLLFWKLMVYVLVPTIPQVSCATRPITYTEEIFGIPHAQITDNDRFVRETFSTPPPDKETDVDRKIREFFGTPELPFDSYNNTNNSVDVNQKLKDIFGTPDNPFHKEKNNENIVGNPINVDKKIESIFGTPDNPKQNNFVSHNEPDRTIPADALEHIFGPSKQDVFLNPPSSERTPVSTRSPYDVIPLGTAHLSNVDEKDEVDDENIYDDEDLENDSKKKVSNDDNSESDNDDDLEDDDDEIEQDDDDDDLNNDDDINDDTTKIDDDDDNTEDDTNSEDSIEDEEDESCLLPDGSNGICVAYYWCNSDTSRRIQSEEKLIDVREKKRVCPKYFDVCCKSSRVRIRQQSAPEVEDRGCGYSNPGADAFRIRTDGTLAQYGEFPWMVAILRNTKGRSSKSKYLGGGSIIHPSVVLTSAHAVKSKRPLIVRGGEWDPKTEGEIYPYQERDVDSVDVHEDYDMRTRGSSIALLFLESPFDLLHAPHMGVACIGRSTPPSGTKCFAMGWGSEHRAAYSVVLNKVEITTISRSKCLRNLRKTVSESFVLDSSFMCGNEEEAQSCDIDSGAPLVCAIGDEDDARYAQYGALLQECGEEEDLPRIFINTAKFKKWISSRMRRNGFDSSSFKYSNQY